MLAEIPIIPGTEMDWVYDKYTETDDSERKFSETVAL